MAYEYVTMSATNSTSFASMSRWRRVTTASSPSTFRSGMSSVITMATPDRIAPATKYGGNSVECQPGTIDTAKSHDTTLWTETTSGVANTAKKRYARE